MKRSPVLSLLLSFLLVNQVFTLKLKSHGSYSARAIGKNKNDGCYYAKFPSFGNSDIGGHFLFSSQNSSTMVNVHFFDYEGNITQIEYYITKQTYEKEKENCDGLEEYFDPYYGIKDCSIAKDTSYCRIGDLSGFSRKLDIEGFALEYEHPYISLDPETTGYIGDKLIVIKYVNGSMLGCAAIQSCNGNITDIEEGHMSHPLGHKCKKKMSRSVPPTSTEDRDTFTKSPTHITSREGIRGLKAFNKFLVDARVSPESMNDTNVLLRGHGNTLENAGTTITSIAFGAIVTVLLAFIL